jgi:NAD(P)H-binding
MRIALLGGSGRIGSHLLAWALRAGHDVTALARDRQSLAPADRLTVIGGQAIDQSAVTATVTDADAVLSALGRRGAVTPALLASAARNIVTGMANSGARRLICVSAAGAFIGRDPDTGPVVKILLSRVLDKPFGFPDTRADGVGRHCQRPGLDAGPADPAGEHAGHRAIPGPARLPAARRAHDRTRRRRAVHRHGGH